MNSLVNVSSKSVRLSKCLSRVTLNTYPAKYLTTTLNPPTCSHQTRPQQLLVGVPQMCHVLQPTSSIQVRSVYKKARPKTTHRPNMSDEDEKSADEEEDDPDDLNNVLKPITIVTKIGRVDTVIKRGFKLTRDKVEQLFYENKIRVNGDLIKKKATTLKTTDVLDVYRSENLEMPGHIFVDRLEIMDSRPVNDGISMKARKYVHLVIPAYPS